MDFVVKNETCRYCYLLVNCKLILVYFDTLSFADSQQFEVESSVDCLYPLVKTALPRWLFDQFAGGCSPCDAIAVYLTLDLGNLCYCTRSHGHQNQKVMQFIY